MEGHEVGSNPSDTVHYILLKSCTNINRDVCDKLLDKSIPEKQRLLRAEAILMIGRVFRAAERDPGQADNGDYAFEQLLASSQKKKKKDVRAPDHERKKTDEF